MPIQAGSIPAHTGNPAVVQKPGLVPGVYPRSYGESVVNMIRILHCEGLSPLIRGIRPNCGGHDRFWGSIPAHTGNPGRHTPEAHIIRVYPRSYGESTSSWTFRTRLTGLSPLIRGIQVRRAWHRSVRGSIPAHTGNPMKAIQNKGLMGVYPRSYGESKYPFCFANSSRGLSPLIRGILFHISS